MAHSHPTTRAEIQPLLEARGMRLRREWGQNLLIDKNLLAAIGRDAGIAAGDMVLEIGVGAGSLTAELIQRARLVLGVDIDRGMAGLTRELLAHATNLVVMRADVMGRHNQLNPAVSAAIRAGLEVCGIPGGGAGFQPASQGGAGFQPASFDSIIDDDGQPIVFPKLEPASEPGVLRVVANLPYQVSSPVMLALLEAELPLTSMTVMLQFEVGRKICAKPGDDDWGLLSLLAQELADCSLLRRVPAACFWPRPKVDSAIVQLNVKPSPDMAAWRRLRAVAHGLFQQRRKRILNGAKLGLGMDGESASKWLAEAGVDQSAHAEALPPEALRRLAECWPGGGESL